MNKLSWQEMKAAYPQEWIAVTDYRLDDSGRLIEGLVSDHSKHKKELYSKISKQKSTALRFTGESNFSGIRIHDSQ